MAKGHKGQSEYLKNSKKHQHDINLANGFKHNLKGSIYTTLQPQTKEYLKHKNITTIDFDKMDEIKKIALEIRQVLLNKRKGMIFETVMIEFYNDAGIVLDIINRGVKANYVDAFVKYKDAIVTNEEKALLAALIIDPELKYYHTYMDNPNNPVKTVKDYYGFVSKELLEIERLYDFIQRHRQTGKSREDISYLANKLYKIEDDKPKR